MPPFPAPKEPARRVCERATLPRSGDSLSGAPACIINTRKDGFQPQPFIQRISHLPRIAAACLIATALFITGCDHPSPAPDHVTLRLTTREPEPETRLEVEFDQAVVEHASLGIAAPSPLAIDPEVPGIFVWRSRRSGVFAPSEPFRLGQRYVVGLRPGLRDGSGKPVDAKLNRKLTLPGLRLEASPHVWWNRDDLPAVPVVSVTANAPLETAELAGRARFIDGHASIAAEVEADPDFPPAPETRAATREHSGRRAAGWPPLLVRPVTPLQSTKVWRLEVAPGLRSPRVARPSDAPFVMELGFVRPFSVRSISSVNEVRGGRKVRIRLSRAAAPSIVTNQLASWFRCDPPVQNLSVERSPDGHFIAVSGAFELGQAYAVGISRDLPAEERVQLEATASTNLTFEPIPPTAWLAHKDTQQLASGRRLLELEALNVPAIRLRAKALDSRGIVPALRAYAGYKRPAEPDEPDTLPGGPLDYAAIDGRTTADIPFNTATNIDSPKVLSVPWDDLTGGRRCGAWFVEVDLHGLERPSGTQIGPQAIVQLTDLGVVAKAGSQNHLAWIFSHSTGLPVVGASVEIRSDENVVLAATTTDADGLSRWSASNEARWLVVSKGDDLHAERLGEGEVPTWNLGVTREWGEPVNDQVFAFTDRGAYRPGERLHLGILARRWIGDTWGTPTNPVVHIGLTGPRGDSLAQTNLTLRSSSGISWDWDVPTGVRGSLVLSISNGAASTQTSFEVREFQPAPFEVSLDAQPVYGPGEAIHIPLTARYLFGEPLARAKVLWTARAEDVPFAPQGWEDFRFDSDELPGDRPQPAPAAPGQAYDSGTTILEAGRPLLLKPNLPPARRNPRPQRITLTAEVTDLDQRTLSRTVEFESHPSAFQLGLHWTGEGGSPLTAESPIGFQVVAVGHDGTPWTQDVAVQARLHRVEWRTTAVQRAGRVIGYENEAFLTQVGEVSLTARPAVQRGTRWDAAPGKDASFPPTGRAGEYQLELEARATGGSEARMTVLLSLAGDGRFAWYRKNGAQLGIVADRKTYAPEGEATLLLQAPFPGTALVTIERENVRRAFTIPVQGSAPAVRVPLFGNDAPNVHVGVLLVRGQSGNPHEAPMPEWRIGYQTLQIPPTHLRLGVAVEASAAEARPGEPVTVRATVRDATGKPVPGAQVTLYAVDEAYLSLTGTRTPDPWSEFHAARGLGVRTTVSLPGLLPEAPELRSFGNKGWVGGGGGRSVPQRRNFNPCPLWEPSLETGSDGSVAARFIAPDAITRYRIVAVAAQGLQHFGAGDSAINVRKLLMIEPATPRFAHVGDHLIARALVFNGTGTTVVATARLGLPPHGRVEPGGNAADTLSVPAHGVAVFDVPVTLVSPGDDAWTWSVEGGGQADTAVAAVPTTFAEPGLHDIRHRRIPATGTNLLGGADPAVLESATSARLSVAATPVALLAGGVDHLLQYPYGCVEQTASSLLPWLALRDFPELLPGHQRSPGDVMKAIQGGVDRLWTMQRESGGLSYWPGGSQPQRWGSAYGAWVLALARDAGAAMPPGRLARLHRWLADKAREDQPDADPETLHERCLTAFALTAGGSPEPALLESLRAESARLTAEDRALLCLALLQSGGSREDAARVLEVPAGAPTGPGLFGSGNRVKALQLLAHSRLDATSQAATGLVGALVSAQSGGRWKTTQDNAWALWSITDNSRRNRAGAPIAGRVHCGTATLSFEVGPDRPVATIELPLSPALAAQGVQLVHDGASPLFGVVHIEGRTTAVPGSPVAIDRGLSIRRKYERLDLANQAGPADALRVGDRVLVTLKVDAPEPAEWVANNDPLPSVLEAVNAEFVTDSTEAGRLLTDSRPDFREVRADRVLAFKDILPEGRFVLRYLARARAAGVAVAAPAHIEAMYEPGRHGLSDGTRLTVQRSAEVPR